MDELPRTLQVLWGEATPTRRTPQALSLDRIVATAIEIADAEGLGALSMARLAERLGSATMSLYRHVANKDELLVFMADAAPGPPPPVDPGAGWRSGLTAWARGLRTVYLRHPWILQINPGRPPIEPGQVAWLDAALGSLAGSGLPMGARMSVVIAVLNYVRGEAQLSAGMMASDWAAPETQEWYGRTLIRLATPDRFPYLAEVLAGQGFQPDESAGADFDHGLALVLDGIGALIEKG